MTGVGHTLTGVAIGVICMPEKKSTWSRIVHLVVFGILANVPDFPFRDWGHHRYSISHSLFVNVLLILFLSTILAFLPNLRTRIGGWPVLIGGAFAWLSHLLLDTFYNHGKGLEMFWPFSKSRLALPIPWFSVVTEKPPPLTPETLHILLVELAFYGSLLLVILFLKKAGVFDRTRRHVFQKSMIAEGSFQSRAPASRRAGHKE